MEVGKPHGSEAFRAQDRYREAMLELVRRTRNKVQSAREEAVELGRDQRARRRREAEARRERNLEDVSQARTRARANAVRTENDEPAPEPRNSGASIERGPDRVDISEHSRVALHRMREILDSGDEVERPRLERLKRHYRRGELNSPERMERAAERLLGARDPARFRDA